MNMVFFRFIQSAKCLFQFQSVDADMMWCTASFNYTLLVADKYSKSIFILNVTGQRPFTHNFEAKQGGVTCSQVPTLSSLKATFTLTPAGAKTMPGGTLGIALAKPPLQAWQK